MIELLKRFWGAAPIAVVILALSVVMSLFFGVRIVAHWVYWNDLAQREQPVAAWMTPGYIGKSWKVPKKVVIEALGAPEPPPDGEFSASVVTAARGRLGCYDQTVCPPDAGPAEFYQLQPSRRGHARRIVPRRQLPPRPGDGHASARAERRRAVAVYSLKSGHNKRILEGTKIA